MPHGSCLGFFVNADQVKRVLFAFLVSLSIADNVTANLISATGAELISHPSVTFPNGSPTVTGSSILFGSPGQDFAKLFEVSLGTFGYQDSIDVTINITRKTVDFDPKFMLTDGSNMFGGAITDDNGGSFYPTRFYDIGIRGVYDGADDGFQNAGFPNVNESISINLRFSFSQTSSTVTGGFLGSSTSFSTSSQYIDPTIGLSFVMLRDNETVESYEINSLLIGTVPEPSTALLLALFVALWSCRLILARRIYASV